jgi:Fe-Mn family superoxide dismutase
MNRRHLLTVGGAAFAGSLVSAPGQQAASATIGLELPPLPYPPEALEPHIDALTMTIHHDKHHASYVTKLGEALQAAKAKSTDPLVIIKSLSEYPEAQQMAIRNNGGGHVNHTLFWQWMAPAGSGPAAPEGKLAEAIQSSFTSLEEFKKAFADAGAKRFGSGWAWLIVESGG